ncbi:MAG: 2-amino-4-hydroxy-6-hydroxymethyldihydropteridine diphosphokinase [Lentisphaerae bacterium]|jgi:2-amino-4-hydroxy-6-hydroxymethyldihydropteridine diphosphokinase|nr:2-amino-4-hydroxy-6-hydroxymethyldihydropteridine diphosphokinase [Lentisphaerota bacterium]
MNGIEVGLSLGANLGDPLTNLRAARNAIAAIPDVNLLASAPLYETEPIGVPDEFLNLNFYNTVVIVGTSLNAHKLFAHLQKIEIALGRKRTIRPNMPRPIDIDMIYYNGQTIRSGGLVIPHPRWTKRRFVLQPLADVRGYLVLPGHDRRVRDILAAMPPGQEIKKILAEW